MKSNGSQTSGLFFFPFLLSFLRAQAPLFSVVEQNIKSRAKELSKKVEVGVEVERVREGGQRRIYRSK